MAYRLAAECTADAAHCEQSDFIVEINEALGPETAALFTEVGFTDVRIENDLNDRPRFVIFRW